MVLYPLSLRFDGVERRAKVISCHSNIGEETLLSSLILGLVDRRRNPVTFVMLLDASQLLNLLEILLAFRLPVEHLADQILLVGTWLHESITQLHQADHTLGVANSNETASWFIHTH